MAAHIDDVEADMLAIYRINDPLTTLPGPRFFKLAYRLPHYQGAIRDRARQEIEEEQAATALAGVEEAQPEAAAEQRVDNWAAFALMTGVPVERVEVPRA